MKYVVVKPRGYADLTDDSREIQEFETNNIIAVDSFIKQQVGKSAVTRKVGDYIFWIANPNEVIEIEDGEIEVPDIEDSLMCNMLINENEFAFGGVVITSNYEVTNNIYAGLNEQDIAYIMNAFTLADAVLVEEPKSGKYIAVDRMFDALLSPNGLSYVEYEDPFTEEIGEDTEDPAIDDKYEDKDPEIFDDIDFGATELPMPELPDDLLVEIEDLEDENLEEFEEDFADFKSFEEIEEGIINEQ